MFISSLGITNFRNHSKKALEFSNTTTILVGPNGAGKTNILEAIYVLARGESWRAGDASEMVEFRSEVGHVEGKIHDKTARVSRVGQPTSLNVQAGMGSGLSEAPLKSNRKNSEKFSDGTSIPSKQSDLVASDLHIVLTRGIVQSRRVAKIKYKVDEIARQKSDFVGRLKVVLFEPESLDIIIGDPKKRRDFLDEALSQTNQEYARSLGVYGKALRTRNKLLFSIREGKARKESLEFWEREMVKYGQGIQDKRQEIVEWVDGQIAEIHITYEASLISEGRLDQYRDREIAAGFTLIGPQRDDFVVATHSERSEESQRDPSSAPERTRDDISRPLSSFGSRGQQRMAVLKLKLLEAEWIEKETGESPLILLDDIFSELDEEHEELVGKLIENRQMILTATEVSTRIEKTSKIIEL